MLLNCRVGEESWESPEIQPVHPKGDQSWVFIGSTNAEAETPNILATWCEELTYLKKPWCWERLRARGEGDDRGYDDWMASPTWWTWVWVDSRSWWWTGRPGVLQFMGSQRVGYDWVTVLNCTECLCEDCNSTIQKFISSSLLSSALSWKRFSLSRVLPKMWYKVQNVIFYWKMKDQLSIFIWFIQFVLLSMHSKNHSLFFK